MNFGSFLYRLGRRFKLKKFLNGRVQNASQFQADNRVWNIQASFNGVNCLAADTGFRRQLNRGNRPFGPELREI